MFVIKIWGGGLKSAFRPSNRMKNQCKIFTSSRYLGGLPPFSKY